MIWFAVGGLIGLLVGSVAACDEPTGSPSTTAPVEEPVLAGDGPKARPIWRRLTDAFAMAVNFAKEVVQAAWPSLRALAVNALVVEAKRILTSRTPALWDPVPSS